MNLIGQLQPRAKVRFVSGDMDPSLAARADRIWMLARLPKTLAWCQVGMMLGGHQAKHSRGSRPVPTPLIGSAV
jgi:hypothetical protein